MGSAVLRLWDVTRAVFPQAAGGPGHFEPRGSILCFSSAQTCQRCQNPCVGAFSELGSEALGSCNYANKGLLTTTAFASFTVWCLGS